MQESQSTSSPQPGQAARRGQRRAWIVGLGMLLLWTYVPLTRGMDLGPMYTRDAEGAWSVRNQDLRHWRGLRVNWSRGPRSQSTVSWWPKTNEDLHTPYPNRRIWVVCQTPGSAAHALGEALVEQLLARENMAEVAFFPYVQLPITEFRPPDLWITLDQLECTSTTLPGYFSADCTVALSITPRLLEAVDKTKQEIAAPYYTTLVHYNGSRMGLISGAGRWKSIGESLAEIAHIGPYLSDLDPRSEGPSAVLGIELLHGPIRCKPIEALASYGTDLKQLKEGPAWMIHDLSVWSLKPGADRRGRIQQLRAALLEEGWKATGHSAHGFRMRLEDRRITVGAQVDGRLLSESDQPTEGVFANTPIGIRHEHPFSTEQCLRFLSQRIEQGLTQPQLQALLAQLDPDRRRSLIASQLDQPLAPPHKLSELPHIETILESLLDPTR